MSKSEPATPWRTGRLRAELLQRTFELGVNILRLAESIPNQPRGWVLTRQLVRSGTSIGANLAEANHALTDAEFTQRCSVARKETAETIYWLHLCTAAEFLDPTDIEQLLSKCDEVLRILTTIVKKTQQRLSGPSQP